MKPKSEIKASPLEEVPLSAQASSSSGLEKVSLKSPSTVHQETLPYPIEEKSSRNPATTGWSFPASPMSWRAEPFDIVSYHLRGQRVSRVSLPAIASDMQFIQFGRASRRGHGTGEAAEKGRCLQLW